MYLLGDIEKRLAGGFKSSGGECGTDVNPVAAETELAEKLVATLVCKVADELVALIEGKAVDKLAAVMVEREAVGTDAKKGLECDVETEEGKLAFCEGAARMEPIKVGAGSYD